MLATFQKEVTGFIEDGERSMLGEAEADLRWKEERRAKLAQCKQNLENVPSTDTIYFLQVGWGKKELTMLYFGVLSHFPWSWGPGALGCAGCSISFLLAQSFSLCSHRETRQPRSSPHCPHLCPVCDSGEANVLPRVGTLMSGRARVWGAPLPPPASHPDSPARGDNLGRRCCSMQGGNVLSPGLKGSEEKVPGTHGQESALLPYAVLGPSPESCQIPNPPGPGGVVEQETALASLKPPETLSFLAQEFQALKVAMEENLSPPLSFQKELNFTKCTQAVGAMKDVLSTACKNQWNHLQGKGIDGLNCQEMEEGLCSLGPSAWMVPCASPSSLRGWEVAAGSMAPVSTGPCLSSPGSCSARVPCTLHNPCLGLRLFEVL